LCKEIVDARTEDGRQTMGHHKSSLWVLCAQVTQISRQSTSFKKIFRSQLSLKRLYVYYEAQYSLECVACISPHNLQHSIVLEKVSLWEQLTFNNVHSITHKWFNISFLFKLIHTEIQQNNSQLSQSIVRQKAINMGLLILFFHETLYFMWVLVKSTSIV